MYMYITGVTSQNYMSNNLMACCCAFYACMYKDRTFTKQARLHVGDISAILSTLI